MQGVDSYTYMSTWTCEREGTELAISTTRVQRLSTHIAHAHAMFRTPRARAPHRSSPCLSPFIVVTPSLIVMVVATRASVICWNVYVSST